MAVLVRERFLCSPFLPLMVRTAETQQQPYCGLGPLSLHAQWHPPCTTTNENKAVGMGVLKRDAYCHWKQSNISETSVWGWAEFWVSLQHWGAGGILYKEINSLPQSCWDNRDVKREFINMLLLVMTPLTELCEVYQSGWDESKNWCRILLCSLHIDTAEIDTSLQK